MNKNRIVGIVFLAMGLIFSTVSGGWALWIANFERTSLKAEAVVVGFDERITHSSDGRNNVSRYPKLRFTDAQGQEHTSTASVSINGFGANLSEDQTVPILYRAENPQSVQVDLFIWKWLFPIILGGLGLSELSIGIGVLIFTRTKKPDDGLVRSF